MSVRVTSVEGVVALFDSTMMVAFGPVFDSAQEAEDFLEFFDDRTGGVDPRDITVGALAVWVDVFRKPGPVRPVRDQAGGAT